MEEESYCTTILSNNTHPENLSVIALNDQAKMPQKNREKIVIRIMFMILQRLGFKKLIWEKKDFTSHILQKHLCGLKND